MRQDKELDSNQLKLTVQERSANSFFRGVIEYMGIANDVIVPSCLKALGLSKVLMI
jgi:hypothetical protein